MRVLSETCHALDGKCRSLKGVGHRVPVLERLEEAFCKRARSTIFCLRTPADNVRHARITDGLAKILGAAPVEEDELEAAATRRRGVGNDATNIFRIDQLQEAARCREAGFRVCVWAQNASRWVLPRSWRSVV